METIGKNYAIYGYKHNGQLYKTWDEAILLDKKEDVYVFGNNETKVTEVDGKTWYTKEAAILFFFKDHWFNIIAQRKKKGMTFYCNMTSPFLLKNHSIQFIDYDLDVRIFSTGSFKILDRREYAYHKRRFQYSKKLDEILKSELSYLIELIRKKSSFFQPEVIESYYEIYKELKEKSKEKITL